jgi:hypothetical protein
MSLQCKCCVLISCFCCVEISCALTTGICSVGIVNEILWDTIGETAVRSFYLAAYEAMRRASCVRGIMWRSFLALTFTPFCTSGTGTGNGPYIAIHEGFQGVSWFDLLGVVGSVIDALC